MGIEMSSHRCRATTLLIGPPYDAHVYPYVATCIMSPNTYLATKGCMRACSAVSLLSGLNTSSFSTKSMASAGAPLSISLSRVMPVSSDPGTCGGLLRIVLAYCDGICCMSDEERRRQHSDYQELLHLYQRREILVCKMLI